MSKSGVLLHRSFLQAFFHYDFCYSLSDFYHSLELMGSQGVLSSQQK